MLFSFPGRPRFRFGGGDDGGRTGLEASWGTTLEWVARRDGMRSSAGIGIGASKTGRLEAGLRMALDW